MKFQTKAIHVGQEPDPSTGAVVVPIYQTSTYAQEDVGVHKGFEYSRTQNPTRIAWERCFASLESGRHGIAFASGMAAISTILTLFQSGDHIVCSDDVYGGTFRVFDKVYSRLGLSFTRADTSDLPALCEALRPETRMIWIETPTNPMLKVTDIRGAARIAADRGILLAVDNTFMSPFLQRPLELGARLVVHSATKYLGGHSDLVGGIVATSDDGLAEALRFRQNAIGAIPGPFDCFLALRGLKTLALRMRQHEAGANRIAAFLSTHPRIERVIHPGLPAHPHHALQKSQADGFGAIISLYVKGDLAATRRFCRSTKLFFLAESLGGVESLIEHPAIMTHASVPPAARQTLGIHDNFVRLSVGVEDPEDLIEDLDRALATL